MHAGAFVSVFKKVLLQSPWLSILSSAWITRERFSQSETFQLPTLFFYRQPQKQ